MLYLLPLTRGINLVETNHRAMKYIQALFTVFAFVAAVVVDTVHAAFTQSRNSEYQKVS